SSSQYFFRPAPIPPAPALTLTSYALLQKSAEPKTLSAAFVATFVGSGIFRLRLRQSLRRRCKTSTFATGSGYPSRGDEQRAIRGNECHHELGRSSAFRPGRGRGGVLGGEP